MQLAGRLIALCLGSLFLKSCQSSTDVITGQAAFFKAFCTYKNMDSIVEHSRLSAVNLGLDADVQITSKVDGVFSIVIWKKNYNLIVAGIPRSKGVHLYAFKRGVVTLHDRNITRILMDGLAVTC